MISGTRRPTTLSVLASGAVLWAVVVALPAIHLHGLRDVDFVQLVLLFGPLIILSGGTLLHNHVFLVVAFPCSMLPVLVLWEELAGPRVYGTGAFIALITATLTFLWTALSEDNPSPPAKTIASSPLVAVTTDRECGPRLLRTQAVAHGLVAAALFYGVLFHRPTRTLIAEAYTGYEARATTIIGLVMFVAWVFALARYLAVGLGRALMAPGRHEAEQFRFEAEALDVERVRVSLVWTVLVGLVSCGALFTVLYLSK